MAKQRKTIFTAVRKWFQKEEISIFEKALGLFAGASSIGGSLVFAWLLARVFGDYSIFSGKVDLDDMAKIGDFVGGVVGSLWAFAGVILFYLALKTQRVELRTQVEELSNHRQEFELQRITNVAYRQIELSNNLLDRISGEGDAGLMVINKMGNFLDRLGQKANSRQFNRSHVEMILGVIGSYEMLYYIRNISATVGVIDQLIAESKDSIKESDAMGIRILIFANIPIQDVVAFLKLAIANLHHVIEDGERKDRLAENYAFHLDIIEGFDNKVGY